MMSVDWPRIIRGIGRYHTLQRVEQSAVDMGRAHSHSFRALFISYPPFGAVTTEFLSRQTG